jgi:leader peptidase (prepilin peptidase)/N-methyltransferase
VVELITGLVFAAVAVWILPRIGVVVAAGAPADGVAISLELAAFLYLAAVGIALLLIDLDTHRLPNALVVPSYAVALVLFASASILTADFERLLTAALGGIILFVFYFAMAFAFPGGMGFGDVKLAGALGLYLGWVGWGALAVGAFGAFLLGGLFSIGLIVLRRAGRKSGIPFGPWMIAGAFVGVFFGQDLAMAYLRLTGLI